MTKFQLWERKLLDMSMSNNLINMSVGKNALSVDKGKIAILEDELSGMTCIVDVSGHNLII